MRQKCLSQGFCASIADGIVQILFGLRQGILWVDRSGMICAGNPSGARRQRRGSAHMRRALDQQHLGPF